MKTMGRWMSDLASSPWKSSPLMPGNLTSSTRQLGASGNLVRKNACVDAKVLTSNPTERNRLPSDSRRRVIVVDDEHE